MITPRRTTLLRAPDLRAFQRIIAGLACQGGLTDRRQRAVIVSTRAAAEQLRRTLETLWFEQHADATTLVLPELLTRDGLYDDLYLRLAQPPPRLSEFERQVLFMRAAREAAAEGAPSPYRLRPGLVVELLGFYDEFRRRHRTVDAFARLVTGPLESSAAIDRGAERLLEQTRFLVLAFRAYERLIAESARLDEQALRVRLLGEPAPTPLTHVVVTVGDRTADRHGLWLADFDLLSRLPGLGRLDIAATEVMLATGLLERLHEVLPEMDDTRPDGDPDEPPVLIAPPVSTGRLYWVARDREEELAAAARRIKTRTAPRAGPGSRRVVDDRLAIVFQRPLPYVYLARQAFEGAGLPYRAFDALPLAAEPMAATLDLVLSAVTAGFTRGPLIALLRSPNLDPAPGANPPAAQDVGALDQLLVDVRFLGGADRLAALAHELSGQPGGAVSGAVVTRAVRALRVAADVAAELQPICDEARPSVHLAGLQAFFERRDRPPAPDAAGRERHARGRAAILGAIIALGQAHLDHDDTPVPFADTAAALRRWIEGQTFAPLTGHGGPHLVAAAAARYGRFDDVRIVGVVEADWPEPERRSIFYPAGLLRELGWSREHETRAAARAAFQDLLRLAERHVMVSTFTLEDDALARPSPYLEELGEMGLVAQHDADDVPARVFAHEALMEEPTVPEAVVGPAAEWLALRQGRASDQAPEFRGAAGPRAEAAVAGYKVSAIETYLECPFKYFARHVLRLDEERDDEPGLSPLERGQLLHEVFQAFYEAWTRDGQVAVTPERLDEARALFARVVEERLARLPEADRTLERLRLLGSAVAPGVGDRAFEWEIESGAAVVDRLLEFALEGEFVFRPASGEQRLVLRGKADRIDMLDDGTLRVIDYKLGRAPKAARAVQLPVYGVCAEQRLSGREGRSWRFGSAGYLAFGEKPPFVSIASSGRPFEEAIAEGSERLVSSVRGIERGAFPVDPHEPFRCTFCPFPTVCRKDYVGDE